MPLVHSMGRGGRSRRLLAVWVAGAVLASVSALAIGSTPASAAGTRIFYSHNCDLWSRAMDGSGKILLTPGTDTSCEVAPSVSRTGRYVAYEKITRTSDSRWARNVWVYDTATKEHTRLTSNGVSADAAFSPIADVVAYSTYKPPPVRAYHIHSVAVDGTQKKQWTSGSMVDPDALLVDRAPSWDPTGKKILFVSNRDGYMCREDMGGYDDLHYAHQLYSVGSAGGLTRLTNKAGFDNVAVEASGSQRVVVGSSHPAAGGGYCGSDPPMTYGVHVGGVRVAKGAAASTPSWSGSSTILYATMAGKVASVPAAGGAASSLFAGGDPDVGAVPATVKRAASTISLNYSTGKNIRANGQVNPAHPGARVTIDLAEQRGDKWVTVATKQPALSELSRYVVKFPRPSKSLCRLTATFPGDADHKPSTSTKLFSC
jgi:hypothetical protein